MEQLLLLDDLSLPKIVDKFLHSFLGALWSGQRQPWPPNMNVPSTGKNSASHERFCFIPSVNSLEAPC